MASATSPFFNASIAQEKRRPTARSSPIRATERCSFVKTSDASVLRMIGAAFASHFPSDERLLGEIRFRKVKRGSITNGPRAASLNHISQSSLGILRHGPASLSDETLTRACPAVWIVHQITNVPNEDGSSTASFRVLTPVTASRL